MALLLKVLSVVVFHLAIAGYVMADGARYRLELDVTWSAQTHPYDWPEEGGHLSDLIGVTHHSRYVMFADGHTATTGLKLVAENGRASIMQAELGEADRRRRIGAVFQADGLKQVPGRIAVDFDAGVDHPLVSFVTMLAPSPDWFTGAASVPLYQDGAWRGRVEGLLLAWDAGTDSGATYVAENAETQPAESIRLLATPHFLTEKGLLPVGKFVLTRLK
ncbi:MAG: spondin domain-containing protein [Gammaproteobacteria bacterium]|nr:spondin domain-containing protein [Gammaproteobacteria bacterium]